MSGTTQDDLYKHFLAISGEQAPGLTGVPSSASEIAVSVMDALTGISLPRDHGAPGRTALADEPMGLFGVGSPAGPAPEKQAMADPVHFDGAVASGWIDRADSGQTIAPGALIASPDGNDTPATSPRSTGPAAGYELDDVFAGISVQQSPVQEGIPGPHQDLAPPLSDTIAPIGQFQNSQTQRGSWSSEAANGSDGGLGSMLAALSDEATRIGPLQDDVERTASSSGEDLSAPLAGATAQIGPLESTASPAEDGTSHAPTGSDGGMAGMLAALNDEITRIGPLQDSVAPTASSSGEDLSAPLADAMGQIGPLQSSATPVASGSTPGATASDGRIGSTLESVGTTILESGLVLAGLIDGLVGLFEGAASAPPPLEKYSMPDRIYFDGATIDGGISDADYDQMGMPRAYSGAPNGTGMPASPTAAPVATAGAANSASAPQITVNVQAIDARSFMDYSTEIAQAVRNAMLNLNSINDVVNDL